MPHIPVMIRIPGKMPGRVDQPGPRPTLPRDARPQRRGRRLGHEQREPRRNGRHRGGPDPDGGVTAPGQDRLADDRPEREAQVEGQRTDVDGLATTLRRREVADRRDGGDEEERLRDPEQRSGDHEQRQRVRSEMQHERPDGEHATEDQQRPAAEPVRRPADHRSQRPAPRWRTPRSRCRRRSRRPRAVPPRTATRPGGPCRPTLKNTRAATNSAPNAGVNSRGWVAGRCRGSTSEAYRRGVPVASTRRHARAGRRTPGHRVGAVTEPKTVRGAFRSS